MRRFLGFGSLCIVALSGLCVFGALALRGYYGGPGVWTDPPIYDGSTGLQVTDYGKMGKLDTAKYNAVHVMKAIRFTAPDSEEKVVAYYRSVFGGPMQPDTWGRTTPGPKSLNYSWTGHGRSPSVYFADLVTEPLNEHETRVEIGLSMFPGY